MGSNCDQSIVVSDQFNKETNSGTPDIRVPRTEGNAWAVCGGGARKL